MWSPIEAPFGPQRIHHKSKNYVCLPERSSMVKALPSSAPEKGQPKVRLLQTLEHNQLSRAMFVKRSFHLSTQFWSQLQLWCRRREAFHKHLTSSPLLFPDECFMRAPMQLCWTSGVAHSSLRTCKPSVLWSLYRSFCAFSPLVSTTLHQLCRCICVFEFLGILIYRY